MCQGARESKNTAMMLMLTFLVISLMTKNVNSKVRIPSKAKGSRTKKGLRMLLPNTGKYLKARPISSRLSPPGIVPNLKSLIIALRTKTVKMDLVSFFINDYYMELCVIIPVYNEEQTIEKVVDSINKHPLVSKIIVVDDGSSDKTGEILDKLKTSKKFDKKLKIIRQKKNLGKGAAVKTGVDNATGDLLIIQDADLEYEPREYVKLIKKHSKNNVVYGSRILGKSKHAYLRTYIGNRVLTSFCNLLFGVKLTDIYTCYKLIPVSIAKSLKIKSSGFELEAEITGKLLAKNIQIVETPISYKPRKYSEGKKIVAKDALLGIVTLVKTRLGVI